MVVAGIALDLGAGMAAGADETGVFSGAIVVQGARPFQGAGLGNEVLLVEGPMGATLKGTDVAAGGGKHLAGERHVFRLAGMRRTGKCQRIVVEAVGIRSAAFHQRQGLHRLAGRTREHSAVRVAEREQRLAVAVDRDDGAAVAAFDQISARHLDQNGIRHILPSIFQVWAMHLAGIHRQKRHCR
ncbi:hypothetical protein ABIA26_004646 [Sinorhizobium fredii]